MDAGARQRHHERTQRQQTPYNGRAHHEPAPATWSQLTHPRRGDRSRLHACRQTPRAGGTAEAAAH
jgi:hypothetical protein